MFEGLEDGSYDLEINGVAVADRVEVIGSSVLILGDSLKVLPHIGKVKCIVSDVPYKLTSGGGNTGQMTGKFARDQYSNSGSFIEADIKFEDFMPLCADCMDQGHAYFMVNNRWVGAIENAALDAGFRFHNWLVWSKTNATPNRWYMKNCEFTLLVFKGKAQAINDCGSGQLVKVKSIRNSEHPTEKPVELMRHYVENSTAPGDLVLDPFMGSGSTLVACIETGRRSIGIEIDPVYFDLARKRVLRATLEQIAA